MVTSLFRYERITTTKAKALEVRKAAEKLITRSKVDSVHNRRQAARYIQDETVLAKLFADIGPRMKDRTGGYTRILKLGFRQGDAADMVILELVDYKLDSDKKSEKKDSKAKAPAAKKAASEKKAAPKKTAASKKAEVSTEESAEKVSE
jgi:large subunit ribosomal protein L17